MRLGFGPGGFESILKASDALGSGELAGRDTEHTAETAEEGEATYSGGLGYVGEARAFGCVLGEVLGRGGDCGGLGIGARGCEVRFAALAGTVACLLCEGCGGEEGDVLPGRAAAGAAWTAIDLRGLEGVEELPVGVRVACEHLLPLAAGKDAGYGEFRRWLRLRDGWVREDARRWRVWAAWDGHCVGSH
jgi:hypothetical protein